MNARLLLVALVGALAVASPAVAQPSRKAFDYDGDGKADIAVYRPSSGTWYIRGSGGGSPVIVQFGISSDVPVEGDFDGDGKADIAVWRRSPGIFYILQSSTGTVRTQQWGAVGDNPRVCADYDGDGITDLAVWRPGPQGVYYVLQSSNGASIQVAWGTSPTDRPLVGYIIGDARAELTVIRWDLGTLRSFWARSLDGTMTFSSQTSGPNYSDLVAAYTWSDGPGVRSLAPMGRGDGERAVPADYDGDGKADMASYVDGVWHIEFSGGGSQKVEWGRADDYPLPRSLVVRYDF